MKNSQKLPKKSWLSVKTSINNPYFYDLFIELRACFNEIIANEDYRKQFAQIKTKKFSPKTGRYMPKMKGEYQKEIKAITGNPLLGKFYQAGEFYNYVCDNIIHLIRSHHEQIEIYNCLKKNNFKIDDDLYDLFDENEEITIFPSHHYLKGLRTAKKIPEFPTHKKFIMDFSVDNHQGFEMDKNLKCTLHVLPIKRLTKRQREKGLTKVPFDGEVQANPYPKDIVFQLYLPAYTRTNLMTGKVAKPMLYYNFDTHDLVCQIAYEIKIPDKSNWKNIMGVDIGKVKLFSAVTLYSDNTFSSEYIPSKELKHLSNKADRIIDHRDNVFHKIKRANAYNYMEYSITNRQRRRNDDYYLTRRKLTRIKSYISKLTANEIIAMALKNQCKEIHMENLHWLLAKGNKWNYSQIQKDVEQLALIFGIKVFRINPAHTSNRHPFTGEKGKAISRDIVFSDGTRYNRDHLAAINIALTQPGQNKNKIAKLKRNSTTHVHRQRRKPLIRKQVQSAFNNSKRAMQIVMFSLKQDTALNLSLKKLSKKTSLCDNVAPKGFLQLNYE